MEFKFKAGAMVRVPGLNRPCEILSARIADRIFKGRTDRVGTKNDLDEPHYNVQIDGSSSTRFVAESKLRLIAPEDLEQARLEAEPLQTGVNQSIDGGAMQAARDRARMKALAEEKARLKEQLEEAKLAAEVEELKAQLAAKQQT